MGYEYTSSTEEREALHRNVIFEVPSDFQHSHFLGLTASILRSLALDGSDAREGVESLAIPHNSNGSNGAMFAYNDFAGNRVDPEYAALRSRNEPLVEITQVKAPPIHIRYCPKMTNGPILKYSRCEPLPVSPVTPTVAMSEMR